MLLNRGTVQNGSNTPIPNSTPGKVAAFVDYESLFWGLWNLYGETPDPKVLFQFIKSLGNLCEITIFGDFSKPEMSRELLKLRAITSNIVDCSTLETKSEAKKDYSDFIMLDRLYQSVHNSDFDIYVLVTGDGHFTNFVAYTKNMRDREVGILAVKGSLSNQLREAASWVQEIAPDTGSCDELANKILKTIANAESKGIYPLFSKTVEVGSKYYAENQQKFAAILSQLIERGLITQEEKQVHNAQTDADITLRVLNPNWELLKKNGYWAPGDEQQ